jgi:hypothetical protein
MGYETFRVDLQQLLLVLVGQVHLHEKLSVRLCGYRGGKRSLRVRVLLSNDGERAGYES